jgi:hypothetical protein
MMNGALRNAHAASAAKKPTVHLFRGAPAVRDWSKYQSTEERWTLCGIRRTPVPGDFIDQTATDDASLVSCPYCLELMRSTARSRQKAAGASA